MKRILLTMITCLIIAAFITSGIVLAGEHDSFPESEITYIVTFGAGGGTDIGVRALVPYLEEQLGVPVNVVNIGGGGGVVGAVELAQSEPDGYTVGNLSSAHVMSWAMDEEVGYNPVESFDIIGNQVLDPRTITARPGEFEDLEDFFDQAREAPGTITISTSGAGSTGHFSNEAMNHFAEVEVVSVHFGGAGESQAAFLGRHVTAVNQTVGEITGMVEDGEAEVVGVFADERLDEFPDAMTFKEVGVDLSMGSYRGIAAPAGVPQERLDILAEAFMNAMADEEYLEAMAGYGFPTVVMGPEEYKEEVEYMMGLFPELVEIVDP